MTKKLKAHHYDPAGIAVRSGPLGRRPGAAACGRGLPCEGLRTQSSVQAVNGTCRNGKGASHLPNIPTGILEAAWSLCLAEAY